MNHNEKNSHSNIFITDSNFCIRNIYPPHPPHPPPPHPPPPQPPPVHPPLPQDGAPQPVAPQPPLDIIRISY